MVRRRGVVTCIEGVDIPCTEGEGEGVLSRDVSAYHMGEGESEDEGEG